jgi:hypothetical protein
LNTPKAIQRDLEALPTPEDEGLLSAQISPLNRLAQLINRQGIIGAVVIPGNDIKVRKTQEILVARRGTQFQQTGLTGNLPPGWPDAIISKH